MPRPAPDSIALHPGSLLPFFLVIEYQQVKPDPNSPVASGRPVGFFLVIESLVSERLKQHII